MPCSPSDLSVTPPDFNEPSIPGFGLPTVDLKPIPGVTLPNGFPEDLIDLIETLKITLPGGALKPNLSPNFDKSPLDAVIKLLDYLSGFLSMYRFILPILNMILCIIEVLCALVNPFKLIKALRRLFRTCIPDFLSLFPVFAIIIMIISLLLLIIALIEYIISEVLRIIDQILKNIRLLARVSKRKDAQGVLAALHKIGAILCLLRNIFAVLQVVAIIIQIIKDIIKLVFRIPPCDDSNQDDDGCCTVDVCPAFIKNGPYTRTTGKLLYFNQVAVDSGLTLPPAFGSLVANIRPESWQFYDPDQLDVQQFYNMTAAFDVNPAFKLSFFPQGKTYDQTTNPTKVAYTLDLRLFYNPYSFARSDVLGVRFIRIKNAIVQNQPTQTLTDYINTGSPFANGVVHLVGGDVFEDDGTTPILVNGVAANINTFLHSDKQGTVSPLDGQPYNDVEYTFNINYPVLVGESIITIGCVPDLDVDKQVINGGFGGAISFNFSRLKNEVVPALPNIDNPIGADGTVMGSGAISCVTNAIAKFRANITIESTAQFQSDMMSCLNLVLNDSKNALGMLVDIGFSSHRSTFTLTPTVQFTTQSIIISAILNDANGQNICSKIPQEVADKVSDKLIPVVSFGTASSFIYDGVGAFQSNITSPVEGSGTAEVKYNDNFFNIITIPTSLSTPPTITLQAIDYSFIHTPASGGAEADGKQRRDEGDVARDNTSE